MNNLLSGINQISHLGGKLGSYDTMFSNKIANDDTVYVTLSRCMSLYNTNYDFTLGVSEMAMV